MSARGHGIINSRIQPLTESGALMRLKILSLPYPMEVSAHAAEENRRFFEALL